MAYCGEAPNGRTLYLRFNCFDIPKVDTKEQQFTLRFYYEVMWEDKTRCELLKDYDEEKFDPRINMGNLIQLEQEKTWFSFDPRYDREFGSTMVCRRTTAIATFVEMYELQYFPFDVQDISVMFRSDWTTGEVTLVSNPYRTNIIAWQDFTTRNTFAYRKQIYVDTLEGKGATVSFPNLEFRIVAHRKPGFIIYNLYIPCAMISTLGLAIFSVDAVKENFIDRFGINTGLLLTLIAYKFATGDSIPEVNYLTSADKFIFLTIMFQTVLAGWTVFANNILDDAEDVDYIAGWIFTGLWLAINLATFYRALFLMKFVDKVVADQSFEDLRSIKNSSFAMRFALTMGGKRHIYSEKEIVMMRHEKVNGLQRRSVASALEPVTSDTQIEVQMPK